MNRHLIRFASFIAKFVYHHCIMPWSQFQCETRKVALGGDHELHLALSIIFPKAFDLPKALISHEQGLGTKDHESRDNTLGQTSSWSRGFWDAWCDRVVIQRRRHPKVSTGGKQLLALLRIILAETVPPGTMPVEITLRVSFMCYANL